MAESVYKVIELVGTSNESWEKAAAAAIEPHRVWQSSDLPGEDGALVQIRGRRLICCHSGD